MYSKGTLNSFCLFVILILAGDDVYLYISLNGQARSVDITYKMLIVNLFLRFHKIEVEREVIS